MTNFRPMWERLRRSISTTSEGFRERGATTLTAAMGLFFMMGLAALTVDGSNLYRERSDVQNAADLTALAAAYDGCTGGSDPVTVARAQAAANGYLHDGSDVVVTVAQEGDDWRATINSKITGFFSDVLGANPLETNATALASCTTAVVKGYALFAGGLCGQETLDWSGSTNLVVGDIHSNDGMDITGSDNTINGETTTVIGITNGGSNNLFNPPATTTTPQPWPQIFYTEDFLPVSHGGNGSVAAEVGSDYHFVDGVIDSGVLIANGWLSGTVLEDGVYVATEDIDLSIGGLTGTVTLVAAPSEEGKGIITLAGSDHVLDPYYKSLLVFSDTWKGSPGYPWDPPPTSYPDCFDPAVKLSGSNQSWTGIQFAPRGMVDLSGSIDVSVSGSIISYTIRIGGSSQEIHFAGPSSTDEPITVLKQ